LVLRCSEAPEGAAGKDPVDSGTGGAPLIEEKHLCYSYTAKNLEGLMEKVGSLGLILPKKNRCGAARKRARKAKLAEAPAGASVVGQPQTASDGQPPSMQKPSTSTAQGGGSASTEPQSPEGGGHPQGPKRQRSAGGTPGRLRGPSRLGNLAMPGLLRRVSGWLLCVKIIPESRCLGMIL
jgi:hypothetical protein